MGFVLLGVAAVLCGVVGGTADDDVDRVVGAAAAVADVLGAAALEVLAEVGGVETTVETVLAAERVVVVGDAELGGRTTTVVCRDGEADADDVALDPPSVPAEDSVLDAGLDDNALVVADAGVDAAVLGATVGEPPWAVEQADARQAAIPTRATRRSRDRRGKGRRTRPECQSRPPETGNLDNLFPDVPQVIRRPAPSPPTTSALGSLIGTGAITPSRARLRRTTTTTTKDHRCNLAVSISVS